MFFRSFNVAGFAKYPLAPSSYASFTSFSSSELLSINVGRTEHSGCSRTQRKTSKPVAPGIFTSRNITEGGITHLVEDPSLFTIARVVLVMRIVVENCLTKLYLTAKGTWTSVLADAKI